MTPFNIVYDAFFNLIADDFYLETTKEETERDLRGILMASLPLYEFPKRAFKYVKVLDPITNEDVDNFSTDLSLEEINIIAQNMVCVWYQRQINTIELTRQKVSGVDFKVSSQAMHLEVLRKAYKDAVDRSWYLQEIETRRREAPDGTYQSTFDEIVKKG